MIIQNEYCDGGSLQQKMENGPLSEPELLLLLAHIADGLAWVLLTFHLKDVHCLFGFLRTSPTMLPCCDVIHTSDSPSLFTVSLSPLSPKLREREEEKRTGWESVVPLLSLSPTLPPSLPLSLSFALTLSYLTSTTLLWGYTITICQSITAVKNRRMTAVTHGLTCFPRYGRATFTYEY